MIIRTEKPTTLPADVAEKLDISIQRARSNFLCFSHLCVETVCRRARTCSADPDICMGRLLPFVPKDVRRGVDALVLGKFDGLSYEQVRANSPFEVSAWEDWIGKIDEFEAQVCAGPAAEGEKSTARPLVFVIFFDA